MCSSIRSSSEGRADVDHHERRRPRPRFDVVARLRHGCGRSDTEISDQVRCEFPSAIFFTCRLTTEHENFMTRLLHNQAALALQRRLHLEGIQMVILPMNI
jgi:hypothetical protein